MYVLLLVFMLTGEELSFSPNDEVVMFNTKAACEQQLARSQKALEKEKIPPFELECRKVE